MNDKRVRDYANMLLNEEILKNHEHKIWKDKNNEYCTYVYEEGGRKLKRRKSKEAMNKFLLDFYSKQDEKPTVENMFNEKIQKKVEFEEISLGTKERYEIDFKRYFFDIKDTPIQNITEYDLENHIKKVIVKQQLTRKNYDNLRTVCNLIFKHARRKGVTDLNIKDFFENIDIGNKMFRKKKTEDRDQVFTYEEREIIETYLVENLDLKNLGILLLFKTGMRIGELVALKREDLGSNYINVERSEIRFRRDGKYCYEIQEAAKTEAGTRTIFLSDSSKWILDRAKKNPYIGEYLFEQDGKRMNVTQISSRFRCVCKKCGVKYRSPHKIRKTYATMLLNGGADERFIINQMGHTDISCTKGYYYYDDKTVQEKIQQLNAVSGL